MKKYLIAVLLISINYSYSQSESTLNLNVTSEIKEVKETDIGIFPQGKGEFIYQGVMIGGVKKSFKYVRTNVKEYAESKNCTYEELDNIYYKGTNRIKLRFKLINKDGTVYLIKEEAIREIKQLKGLLDLGILTQEEFNKKAIILKKAILN
tara:strand:- start:17 stop:469 length:453 start_codon:yes stop_codon:yes gene_type:complete